MKRIAKFFEYILSPRNLNPTTKSILIDNLHNSINSSQLNFNLSKDITYFIVTQSIRKRINDRNLEFSFLPVESQKSNQIKVLGFNNSLIQNSIWANIDDGNVNLKQELLLSDADIYFIIKDIFKLLKIRFSNELVIIQVFQIIKERNVEKKSELQEVLYELIGDIGESKRKEEKVVIANESAEKTQK